MPRPWHLPWAAFAQLFFSLACRSHGRTMPQLGFFSNPYLLGAILASGLLQLAAITLPFTSAIFKTTPLALEDWGVVLLLALAPVTVIEVTKLLRAAFARRR